MDCTSSRESTRRFALDPLRLLGCRPTGCLQRPVLRHFHEFLLNRLDHFLAVVLLVQSDQLVDRLRNSLEVRVSSRRRPPSASITTRSSVNASSF